jgi:hypothetical protein
MRGTLFADNSRLAGKAAGTSGWAEGSTSAGWLAWCAAAGDVVSFQLSELAMVEWPCLWQQLLLVSVVGLCGHLRQQRGTH